VCFADLVGFTRLGGEVEGQELGTLANRLAELAGEAAAAPTRLVKTIGDAAMLVSREVPPLVEAALELVAAAEREDLPALRAGIAHGPATVRAGDFYGNSVNLASRVTGVARPGSVLCTEDVRDAAAEQFDWSFAGKHRLKGVSHPIPLYRARPLAAAPHGEAAKKRPADRPRRRAAR
jgi:adenylate cyclase